MLLHLADAIRERAKERGYSIEGLAAEAEVSKSMMWSVLACAHSPNISWITKVANALKCRPSDLLP